MAGVISPRNSRYPEVSSGRGSSSSSVGLRTPQHSTPVKDPDSQRSTRSSLSTPNHTPTAPANSSNEQFTDHQLLVASPFGSHHSSACSTPVRQTNNISSLSTVRRNLNSSLSNCDTSPVHTNHSFSSHKNDGRNDSYSSISASKQARLAEFENATIQKQRQELQLLIAELRDRDRELNDMMVGHAKQLSAWEQDRQCIASLEDKCARMAREVQLKDETVRALEVKLRITESEDANNVTALSSTQEQLAYITDQQMQSQVALKEIEDKNRNLNHSVMDISNVVGQLEAREQELITVLQLKDRDLSEASSTLAELSAKIKKGESDFNERCTFEAEARRQITDWKNRYTDTRRELDHFKKTVSRLECESEEQQIEIQKLRQETSTLRKEVSLSNERERRKDQLLELQRSKQERADTELANVRQLYERQQRDLSQLHMNLERTKELLHKHNIISDYSFDRAVSGFGSSFGAGSLSRSGGGDARSPVRAPYGSPSRSLRGEYGYTESANYSGPSRVDCSDERSKYTGSFLAKANKPSSTSDQEGTSSVSINLPTSGESTDHEHEFNHKLLETPPPSAQVTQLRTQMQSQSESPATKLHKLLTESRDMVEELENSVTPREKDTDSVDSRSSRSSKACSNGRSPVRQQQEVISDIE